MMRVKIGRDKNGNDRAVIRFGKYLDKGVWLTHPALRGFRFRSTFMRLWAIDIYW